MLLTMEGADDHIVDTMRTFCKQSIRAIIDTKIVEIQEKKAPADGPYVW